MAPHAPESISRFPEALPSMVGELMEATNGSWPWDFWWPLSGAWGAIGGLQGCGVNFLLVELGPLGISGGKKSN